MALEILVNTGSKLRNKLQWNLKRNSCIFQMHLKMSFVEWQPFHLGLNVLSHGHTDMRFIIWILYLGYCHRWWFRSYYWDFSRRHGWLIPSAENYIMSLLILAPTSKVFQFNSLGHSDVIWRWWSWSKLVLVMACCLTAPSHYLNQCWISKVLRHSSDDIIIRRLEDINQ